MCGFSDMPLVSISNSQRKPIPNANFAATVYHGIAAAVAQAELQAERGLCGILGTYIPEKRAGPRRSGSPRRCGVQIKIAAKIDKVDEAYFRETIAPLFNQPGVEYVGEIDERSKSEFLGRASALLFPIDWPEPFGLSMIEAMACGTPVLAFRCGSVPEIVDPGATGMIVETDGRGDQGIAAGSRARSPRSAAKIRAAIFRCAHGQGLCPGISFAHQAAGRCSSGTLHCRGASRSLNRE